MEQHMSKPTPYFHNRQDLDKVEHRGPHHEKGDEGRENHARMKNHEGREEHAAMKENEGRDFFNREGSGPTAPKK